MDVIIPKPPASDAYLLHRLVAEMHPEGALWHDDGRNLIVRSKTQPLPDVPSAGTLLGFRVAARVTLKRASKRRDARPGDIQTRRQWLVSRGRHWGFEVVSMYCECHRLNIKTRDARFSVDATQFAGVLRVTDRDRLARAMLAGITPTGLAYGLGMLFLGTPSNVSTVQPTPTTETE